MQAIAIDPLPQVLTINEKRVKALFDEGKTMFQIALRLHMGLKAVRDIIFEIRKKEAINMAGKPKLTAEERAEVVERFKNGESTKDLAASYYVARATIDNILNNAGVPRKRTGRPKKMKTTGINKDFDAAVNDMIAENPSADAEQKTAIAEPRPIDKIPKYIWDALDDTLCNINYDIEQRVLRIEELQEEIQQLEEKKRQIHDWMEVRK